MMCLCFFRVMSYIATSTKNIKKELEEHLKLCNWDRPEKLMFVENSKRNRLKLKKRIKDYTVSKSAYVYNYF